MSFVIHTDLHTHTHTHLYNAGKSIIFFFFLSKIALIQHITSHLINEVKNWQFLNFSVKIKISNIKYANNGKTIFIIFVLFIYGVCGQWRSEDNFWKFFFSTTWV